MSRENQTPAPPKGELTPLMRQFFDIKEQHPEHIIFFRCGDFYEMFFDDALTCHQVLGITLTSRGTDPEGKPVPLAGIPYHSVEPYLARMVKAGYRVAMCEQMENPKQAKGVVKREVVRVVSAGTALEETLLNEKSNNYLVALTRTTTRQGMLSIGLAALDYSTGEFMAGEWTGDMITRHLFTEIARLNPSEIVVPADEREAFLDDDSWEEIVACGSATTHSPKTPLSTVDPAAVSAHSARQMLLKYYGIRDFNGFGLESKPLAIRAAAIVMQYLLETQQNIPGHIGALRSLEPGSHMVLDPVTQRSLELVANLTDATRRHTLLDVLDFTCTPMGGRTLRSWILQPLTESMQIRARSDSVEILVKFSDYREQVRSGLRQIGDLERIVGRAVCGTANARDLVALCNSLRQIPPLRELLQQAVKSAGKDSELLMGELAAELDPLQDLHALLDGALQEAPPVSIREGGMIASGFHPPLDELRNIATDSKSWIAALCKKESERTGIGNLKIGYNRVFGYYLEVSRSHAAKVPPEWIRKQTLTGAERYVTPELKEKEEVILHADERADEMELAIFEQLRQHVVDHGKRIQASAQKIAQVDTLVALAEAAIRYHYCKPIVYNSGEAPEPGLLQIREGRHPVIETIRTDNPFVPNDTRMNRESDQLLLITGPNMAGKSTYIRQVALITLMAQAGSFVPAAEATMEVSDRIFTRVGAMDQLAKGQSTFLVEMSETANILNHATDHSLVILDEIGRGTSTYDGLSIAWSVLEYLHNTSGRRPRTLFATHYHELAALEGPLERVKNYNVAVHEEAERITFLYRILRGHTDHSYGIYAAQVAGLPKAAVERARRILADLEKGNAVHVSTGENGKAVPPARLRVEERTVQLTLFDVDEHPVLEELRKLDLNTLTPLQALSALAELKHKTGK